VPAEVGEKAPGLTLPTAGREIIDGEGNILARRVEPSTKDHPEQDALLEDLDGAL
jgi:hypothetical protein